jgi:hypothetical protein
VHKGAMNIFAEFALTLLLATVAALGAATIARHFSPLGNQSFDKVIQIK